MVISQGSILLGEAACYCTVFLCYNAATMPAGLDRITLFCFGASYAVALLLELLHLLRPRPVLRILSLGFGTAGPLAHTLFLFLQGISLASQMVSLLFLGWILAIFYLFGLIHHRIFACGAFL